jgi:flagellar biosynthesis chaperone FliJ
MAQFQYRLQTLLDQKMREKEQAQQDLAAAQKELRAEETELETCRLQQQGAEARLRNARAEMRFPVNGGSSGEWLCLRRDYIGRLMGECDDASDVTRTQELRVSEAEERLADARQTLASRSRDVEVLEKHRGRLERRFNNEAERKMALDQEEMANVIFLQGKHDHENHR